MIDEQLARIEEEMNKKPPKQLEDKLKQRFTKRPWLVEMQGFRKLAYPISIAMQGVSMAFGFYGMKVLMEVMPIPIPYFDVIGAIIGLFTLEYFKRKFSDSFWDSFFAYRKRGQIFQVTGQAITKVRWSSAVINVLIFSASMFITVGGAYFVSKDYSPEAKLKGTTSNPEAVALIDERADYKEQIAANKESIAKHEKNKVKADGKIVTSWPSQVAIENLEAANLSLTASISVINATLKDQHGILNIQNKQILKDAEIRSQYSRATIITALSIFEIVFEALMAFMSYYDVRLYIARQLNQKKKKPINGKKHSALVN